MFRAGRRQVTPVWARAGHVELVIDLTHLYGMTLGDAALEREVLSLFHAQAALLMEKMRGSDSAAVSALAHTLMAQRSASAPTRSRVRHFRSIPPNKRQCFGSTGRVDVA